VRTLQYVTLIILCLLCSVSTRAAHNPLLPQPQQILISRKRNFHRTSVMPRFQRPTLQP
jgi:hypothetical protein